MARVDLAIAAIADRQHGNITRAQLVGLGVNKDRVAHRVRVGRLHRVHRGVYPVGRPPRTALERAAAAVLACGPGAALNHRSALALWGFVDRWSAGFEVTVPHDRRPSGIKTHRCGCLAPRDLRRHNGIGVTSPARTLLDCAPLISAKVLARPVNEARLSRKLE